MTRLLLAIALAGAVCGYLLGGLTWHAYLSLSFPALQVYLVSMSVPWIGAIVLVNSTFGQDFPMNRPDSLQRVISCAPLWSKVLVPAAFACSFGLLFWVAGGSVHIADWSTAEPWQRGIFFILIASMWLIPVPALLAVEQRAA